MDNGEGLSRELLISILECAPANIFFKDTECRYRFISEVCSLVNSGEDHSIIGKTDLDIFDDENLGRSYYEDDLNILKTGQGSEMINEFSTDEGAQYYQISKKPVTDNGKIVGIMGIISNITREKLLEKELAELSFKDKLTGLRNRNYMEVHSDHLMCSENYPVSLVVADCNYLKKINDTLGHEYGDVLLKRVAKVLQSCVPEGCTPIRLGGDEFLISCKNTSADETRILISNIKEELARRSDETINLDMALGFYTVSGNSNTLSFGKALHYADQDMYRNKTLARSL